MIKRKSIEVVSDISMADIVTVTSVFKAICKAGPLNPARINAMKALGMKEYFDGSSIKLWVNVNLHDLEG